MSLHYEITFKKIKRAFILRNIYSTWTRNKIVFSLETWLINSNDDVITPTYCLKIRNQI